MRKAAAFLIVAALLLVTSRLFTGIVYDRDSAVASFVIKTMPDARIERPEAEGRPLGQMVVLDSEETQLSYGWLYIAAMRAVPWLAIVMIVVALLLRQVGGHPARRVRRRRL